MAERRNEIDRRIPSACGEVLSQLVPTAQLRSVMRVLGRSIQAAHKADPSKWGLRLDFRSVMLKVGMVEVFQFGNDWCSINVKRDDLPMEFLSQSSLGTLGPPYGRDGRYKYLPGCDSWRTSLSDSLRSYAKLRSAHAAAIGIAAMYRINPSTKRTHAPGLVAFLAEQLSVALPQPAYATVAQRDFRLPEEPSEFEIFEEGTVMRVEVNRFERDRRARERCIEHYTSRCSVCDVELADRYGPELTGKIQVHHLKPLASLAARQQSTPSPTFAQSVRIATTSFTRPIRRVRSKR